MGGSDESNSGLSDTEENAVDQYKLAYDAHSDGLRRLGSGFDRYDRDEHERAQSNFETAREWMFNAHEDLLAVTGELENTSSIENIQSTMSDLTSTNQDARMAAQSCSNAARFLQSNISVVEQQNIIEDHQQEYQNGWFDLLTPEKFEQEFQ